MNVVPEEFIFVLSQVRIKTRIGVSIFYSPLFNCHRYKNKRKLNVIFSKQSPQAKLEKGSGKRKMTSEIYIEIGMINKTHFFLHHVSNLAEYTSVGYPNRSLDSQIINCMIYKKFITSADEECVVCTMTDDGIFASCQTHHTGKMITRSSEDITGAIRMMLEENIGEKGTQKKYVVCEYVYSDKYFKIYLMALNFEFISDVWKTVDLAPIHGIQYYETTKPFM
jgi:hypothetical protein